MSDSDGDILEGGGIEYEVVDGDTLDKICRNHPELKYPTWEEMRDYNIDEIKSVGRAHMEALGVKETDSYTPCWSYPAYKDKENHTPGPGKPANFKNHSIINGIHYDGVDQPTIYPGTTLFLRVNKAPPKKEPEPEPTPKTGKTIKKPERIWFTVKHQHPNPRLEVYTKNDPKNPDLIYDGEGAGRNTVSKKLLSYDFTESVDDLEGSFSFTVEDDEITSGGKTYTTFDSIPLRSVVKIYEADRRYPVFIGIVKSRRIKSAMSAHGPKRTIAFSGKSIIGVIADYTVSLDFKIMNVADPAIVTGRYTRDLSQKDNLTIKDFMVKTWDFFVELSTGLKESGEGGESAGAKGVAADGMRDIINKFIEGGVPGCIETGGERKIYYPIANAPFNQSNNVISNLWRNILPEPVYEIYAYCDRYDGKPKIMAREAPFGCKDTNNKDWNGTDVYEIDPTALIDYDLNQSDDEVYTVFSAWLIGSAMDRKFNIAKEQDKPDDVFAKDDAKLAIYGYKPLEINFQGYDTQYTKTDSRRKKFTELNQKAKYQYGRLDDMYSGSMTLVTDFIKPEDNEWDKNPRIGCRARFLGGEFYITRASHRWQYGGTPTNTLSITRGMRYDDDGYMGDGADGVIPDIGKRFKELE